MKFIKHFNTKGGSVGSFGSAIFGDGYLRIRIPNTFDIVEKGFIDGGFGLVVKPCEGRKSPYTTIHTRIDTEYLPQELRGEKYIFGIPAEQISDTEIVFMYKRAKMLNKK